MATIEKDRISGLLGGYQTERELSESLARISSDPGRWYCFAGDALTRPFPSDEWAEGPLGETVLRSDDDEAPSAEGYREFATDAMSWAEGSLVASFEVWPHE